jgi:hypothetical protein
VTPATIRRTSRATTRGTSQAGIATVMFPLLLWFVTLLAIVVVDIGAYLVAAARAQAAADGAALAAVAADATVGGHAPAAEARRVAHAAGGQLEHCWCAAGRDAAQVTVSVPVPGLVVPALGAARVSADASAVLAPPEPGAGGARPGPSRGRAPSDGAGPRRTER